MVESEEEAPTAFEDPIKIGVVCQGIGTISKCKHPMNLVDQSLGTQLGLDIRSVDSGADPLIGPPSSHSAPNVTIPAAGRVVMKADEMSSIF